MPRRVLLTGAFITLPSEQQERSRIVGKTTANKPKQKATGAKHTR